MSVLFWVPSVVNLILFSKILVSQSRSFIIGFFDNSHHCQNCQIPPKLRRSAGVSNAEAHCRNPEGKARRIWPSQFVQPKPTALQLFNLDSLAITKFWQFVYAATFST